MTGGLARSPSTFLPWIWDILLANSGTIFFYFTSKSSKFQPFKFLNNFLLERQVGVSGFFLVSLSNGWGVLFPLIILPFFIRCLFALGSEFLSLGSIMDCFGAWDCPVVLLGSLFPGVGRREGEVYRWEGMNREEKSVKNFLFFEVGRKRELLGVRI